MSKHLPTPASGPLPAERTPEAPLPDSAHFDAEWEGGSSGPSVLQRYFGALQRYKWFVLAMGILGVAVGLAATRFLHPEYVAATTLYVQTNNGDGDRGPIQQGELLQTSGAWLDLLRTDTVLVPVIKELGLYLHPETPADSVFFRSFRLGDRSTPGAYLFRVDPSGSRFTLSTASGTTVEQGRKGEVIGEKLGWSWAPPPALFQPNRELEFAVLNPHSAAVALGANLNATLAQNGNFLTLQLTGTDPGRITVALNRVAARFVEVAAELKAASLKEKAGILDTQLASAADKLRSTESQLEGYRVQTITKPSETAGPVVPGIGMTQDPAISRFFDLRLQREQLGQDRSAILRATRSKNPVDALETIPSVQQSSEMKVALAELTQKQADLRALQQKYTDEYRPVQQLQQDIQTLQTQTIPRLASGLASELNTRAGQLNRQIGSQEEELKQMPPRQIEEARLERQRDIDAGLYQNLRQRFEQARLAALTSTPDVRVLDEGVVPQVPTTDSRTSFLLISILAGLGIGLAGVFVLDRFDQRVHYPEQVVEEMGLPILGAVPDVRGSAARVGSGDEAAHAVEAFRSLRLDLVHAYGQPGPMALTITSAASGDGKSFVSSNLALSFADLGHSVLLIDGDTRRGALHKLFGVSRKPGLTDYLAGNATAEEIIQQTSYPSLQIIGCGTRMQSSPELLGSSAMTRLLSELRARYSVILFDSPPLGAGVDPLILGTLTGNVVVVVRNGATHRDYAGAKLDLLDRLPIRVLGAVLNGISPNGAYRYYSYLPGYSAGGDEDLRETRALQGV